MDGNAGRDITYQNDGDKGGRSGHTTWIYNSSTTIQAKAEFKARGEVLSVRNGTSEHVDATLYRASTGRAIGFVVAYAGSGLGHPTTKDLDIAEGTEVYLKLKASNGAFCTVTNMIA